MRVLHRGVIKIKNHSLQQISIDPQFGCLYLQFSQEKITKTVQHTDFINIDLDKKGSLVGIEFVGVKKIKRNMRRIFIELARVYNRPELKSIPKELKRDLAVV